MKGYKGFNKGLICRGKQYAENTIFEEPEAKICKRGMHFCETPFDVLDYYGFMDYNGELNEFAEVEALDEVKTNDNKKYCTKKLKIGAKLSLTEFIRACAERTENLNHSKDFDKISSSINDIRIGVMGWGSTIASTGYESTATSTGNFSTVTSTGRNSTVASTGDESTIVSTGHNSKVASTGDESTIVSTGSASTVASTGRNSTVASTGRFCIICCTGYGSRAKAKKGSWITLAEWKWVEGKEDFVPVNVKTEYVDGEHIKEDTYYELVNGEFQEVF